MLLSFNVFSRLGKSIFCKNMEAASFHNKKAQARDACARRGEKLD
jgi:hypothetical protein